MLSVINPCREKVPTPILFELHDVSWTLGNKAIVKKTSLMIPANKRVGIIGPNGAGKTSLLKILHGQIVPSSGQVNFQGDALELFSLKQKAQKIAYAAQHPELAFDLSLNEVVLAGRLPYQHLFSSYTSDDQRRVTAALRQFDLAELAEQPFNTLSGGEQQRAFLARSYVQQASTLLLDEPTNHLDIKHQLQLMQYLSTFNGSVVMTLHDLNIASQYCDELILMANGEVIAQGEPKAVLTEQNIANVYGVICRVEQGLTGVPMLQFCLAEPAVPEGTHD